MRTGDKRADRTREGAVGTRCPRCGGRMRYRTREGVQTAFVSLARPWMRVCPECSASEAVEQAVARRMLAATDHRGARWWA